MIRNVKEYIELPLLHNHWYAAGLAEEFGTEPKARTLLDESIVFYRTGSGELTALQNRCLHRSFPLSESTVDGDNIVCGYHGACYSPEGQVLRVPSQANPPNISLRKFPVREVGPLVFIWMGEGEPDEARFPEVSHLADPAFRTIHGAYHVEGSYLLMQENLHDLSHLAYLHRESFQIDDQFFDNPVEIETTERGVVAKRTHLYNQRVFLPPSVLEALGDDPVWRYDTTVSPSPALNEAYIVTGRGENEGDDDAPMQQYIMHFLTPETKSTCHYWYAVSLDHGIEDDMYFEMAPMGFEMGFVEDIKACKDMQELLENQTPSFTEHNFGSDKHGMLFRRVVMGWAQEEYGENLENA